MVILLYVKSYHVFSFIYDDKGNLMNIEVVEHGNVIGVDD
jgi:hypothetical protein